MAEITSLLISQAPKIQAKRTNLSIHGEVFFPAEFARQVPNLAHGDVVTNIANICTDWPDCLSTCTISWVQTTEVSPQVMAAGIDIETCSRCDKPAILHQEYSGQHFCAYHLRQSIRKRVSKDLRGQLVLPKNANHDDGRPFTVLACVSGGKRFSSTIGYAGRYYRKAKRRANYCWLC